MKLTTIITNMASKVKKQDFLRTLESVKILGSEVIVIDDSGSDNIPEGYYKEQEDYQLIINQDNIGTFASRKLAFSISEGDFIQHIDAGDEIQANRLTKKKLSESLNSEDCFYHIKQSKDYYIATGDHLVDDRILLAYASSNANTSLCMLIVHRNILNEVYSVIDGYGGGFPYLTQSEDYLLIQLMINSGLINKVTTLSPSIIKYCYNDTQISKPRMLEKEVLNNYHKQEKYIKSVLNKEIANELVLKVCLDRVKRWFEHLSL